jgi:hypothetical protein
MKHPPPQCLFFFLTFALILSACVSAPVGAPPPDWVTNGMEAAYPQKAYIAVEGRRNSRKAAEADALAALSRYFISNVETITQTAQVFSSETGISEHLSERNFVHSASKLFAVRYSSVWFDAHEKQAQLSAKLNTARSMASVYIETNSMAANYQNIIDNNKAMSQAERSIYTDIIKDIRARGVEAMTGK